MKKLWKSILTFKVRSIISFSIFSSFVGCSTNSQAYSSVENQIHHNTDEFDSLEIPEISEDNKQHSYDISETIMDKIDEDNLFEGNYQEETLIQEDYFYKEQKQENTFESKQKIGITNNKPNSEEKDSPPPHDELTDLEANTILNNFKNNIQKKNDYRPVIKEFLLTKEEINQPLEKKDTPITTHNKIQNQEKMSSIPKFIVTAFVNERILIKFEGDGWFLSDFNTSSIKLLSKEYLPTNQTLFQLQGDNPGEYLLEFSRFLVGKIEKQIALLKIDLPESKIKKEKISNQNELKKSSLETQSLIHTESQESKVEDKNISVLPSILQSNDSSNSKIQTLKKKDSQKIISPDDISRKNPDPKKNEPQSKKPIFQNSELKISKNEINVLDKNSLQILFESFFTKKSDENLETTLKIGETFVNKFPKDNKSGEIFYHLGQILEKQTPLMDRKKAYSYYKKSYQDYPLSSHGKLSKDRMMYLEQFYLRLP